MQMFEADDKSLLKEESQVDGWDNQYDADIDLLFGKYGLPQ